MNQDEFGSQIDRLKSVYGAPKYPEERVKAIWREFRYLPVDDFVEMVTDMIASQVYAPMIDKFREARSRVSSSMHQSRNSNRDEWLDRQADCSLCKKLGYIVALEKETKLIYAFSCGCDIGLKLRYRYPKWSESLSDRFDVTRASVGAIRHVHVDAGGMLKQL